MASSLPSVLVLDHFFIRRLRDDLCSHFDSQADVTLGPSNDAIVHLHGVQLAAVILEIQWNPGNSNSEGEQKTVRVRGVLSYRGRLKYPIF